MSNDLKQSDQLLPNGQVLRNGNRYGCHVDLVGNQEPDGCVIDEGCWDDCAFGTLESGRERKSRWTCPHWKMVKT